MRLMDLERLEGVTPPRERERPRSPRALELLLRRDESARPLEPSLFGAVDRPGAPKEEVEAAPRTRGLGRRRDEACVENEARANEGQRPEARREHERPGQLGAPDGLVSPRDEQAQSPKSSSVRRSAEARRARVLPQVRSAWIFSS